MIPITIDACLLPPDIDADILIIIFRKVRMRHFRCHTMPMILMFFLRSARFVVRPIFFFFFFTLMPCARAKADADAFLMMTFDALIILLICHVYALERDTMCYADVPLFIILMLMPLFYAPFRRLIKDDDDVHYFAYFD